MSGFKEHFRNEKRANTIKFIKNLFNNFGNYGDKTKFFILFWIFLVSTFVLFYNTLMFENKHPLECGTIYDMNYHENTEHEKSYHIFIKTPTTIESYNVSKYKWDQYSTLFKSSKNVEYCDTYLDKRYLFMIILTIFLALLSFIYFIKHCNEY